MTPGWACTFCDQANGPKQHYCGGCGRPKAQASGKPDAQAMAALRRCPIDGAELYANGTCSKTGGYPYGTKCPFVCPTCRQPLDWSGHCAGCRNYPGDRWDAFYDDLTPISDGHHVHKLGDPRAVVQAGDPLVSAPEPQPEPTTAQTYACALAFEAYQRGVISKQAALATYAQVFRHPDQADDVVAFYRGKLSKSPTGRSDGPERAGEILRRGPAVDPAIRAKLLAQEVSSWPNR